MRRFTSGPKPAVAGRRVHRRGVGAVDPQAVAHAVVAREVARRLGRGDEVVGGEPVGDGGIETTSIVAPASLSASAAASRRASTSGAMPSRSSATMPMRRPSTPSFRRRRGRGRARGIDVESIGSWPAMTSSEQRRIGDRRGERTDLVEARRERDEPVARHEAVRGLDADDTAERGRLADRAAGIGAESQRGELGGDRRRAAARRAARPRGWGRAGCGWARTPSSRSTIPSRTRRGSSCRHDGAGGDEPFDHGRVVGRLPAVEDPRRARRGHAPRAQVVLERDRHAGERARIVAGGDTRVDGGRRRTGLVGSHEVERV